MLLGSGCLSLQDDVQLQEQEGMHRVLLQLMEVWHVPSGNLLYTAQDGEDLSFWLRVFVENGGDFSELSIG
jgi:hypothetical protein